MANPSLLSLPPSFTRSPLSPPPPLLSSMATAPKVSAAAAVPFSAPGAPRHRPAITIPHNQEYSTSYRVLSWGSRKNAVCKAAEVSKVEEPATSTGGDDGRNWVPAVPLAALPKGERRVIIQEGETILLLWYKDEIFAIENRSPAEGAYSEGLLNAKLTQDGCIVCPSTDSTFDLRTGAIKDWFPKNPVLRALTPALRTLYLYPVKTDAENIYISMEGNIVLEGSASAEIVFSGRAQPGVTASNVNVEEVRMIVDEDVGGFGFTVRNELINGKAAIIGFLLLIDFELLTGKGLLKGTGFLDFIYAASNGFGSS